MRFRWRFILPAFLVTMMVLGASLMLPRKYEAEAIFERRTDMVLNEIMSRGGSPVIQRPQQSLNQQLAGSPAIDKLVKQLDTALASKTIINAGQTDAARLRSELERLVMVKYDISSTTLDRVRVNYVSENPLLARMVVNGLVTNYIDKTRKEINDKLQESARFFKAEVARCRTNIENIENEKLIYEIKHGSLLPDSPNNVQLSIIDAQTQLTDAQQKYEAAMLRVKALSQSFDNTAKTTPSVVTERNPEMLKLQERMNKLRETENQYVNTYKMKEKHPDLVALREDIAKLMITLVQTPAEVVTEQRMDVNPQYSQLDLMLTQATVERDAYNAAVKQSKTRLATLENQSEKFFPVRAEYRKISRDVDQQQRQLTFWEDNLRRVEMAMTAESGNRGILLEFIKPCEAIMLPVSPNLIQVLMAACMLGVAAGGISVLAAYRADESFHEGEELSRAFELPLMGAVSELISRRQRRLRKLKVMIVYPASGVVMVVVLMALAGTVYTSLRSPRKFALDTPAQIKAHTASVPVQSNRQLSQPQQAQPHEPAQEQARATTQVDNTQTMAALLAPMSSSMSSNMLSARARQVAIDKELSSNPQD